MSRNFNRTFLLILLISLFICSANAEILTGTLSSSNITSYNYDSPAGAGGGPVNLVALTVVNIENTVGAKYYIRADNGEIPTFSFPLNNSGSAHFHAFLAGSEVGNGTIGYQRHFDNTGAEQDGFQYLIFDNWGVTTITGTQQIDLTWNAGELGQSFSLTITGTPIAPPPTGFMSFTHTAGFFTLAGSNTLTFESIVNNEWVAEKPKGLNIQGSVNKHIGGTIYPSRVFIVNGTSDKIITSEATSTPDDYYFTVPDETIKICVLNPPGNAWANTSVLFITTSVYSLSVTPEIINYGDNFTMNIVSPTGTYADIQEVRYGYTKSTGEQDILHEGVHPTYLEDYLLIAGTWFQYDTATGSFSINKGATIPNPVITIGDSRGNIAVGNYTIEGYLFKTDNSVQTITDTLIIQQSINQELIIQAKDYLTGDLISGAHINVQNIASGAWINQTPVSGSVTLYYPYGTHLFIESSKTNYVTAYKNWTVTSVPHYTLWMLLSRGITPPAANVTLNVNVMDGFDYAFLPGAKVNLSDGQVKYTSASGIASFTTAENTTYSLSVSKLGYQTAGDTINTGAGGAALEELIVLQRYTPVTITPTPTPPTPTPSPTPTLPGYHAGNATFTGFWGPFENMFLAMGADAGEVGPLMAFVLALIGLFVGAMGPSMVVGSMGFNAVGGEIGALLGITASVAFGFFPLYLSIIVVCCLILYVSLRVYGVTR